MSAGWVFWNTKSHLQQGLTSSFHVVLFFLLIWLRATWQWLFLGSSTPPLHTARTSSRMHLAPICHESLVRYFSGAPPALKEPHGILLHLQERRQEFKEPPLLTASLIGSKIPVSLKCWLRMLRKYYLPGSSFSDRLQNDFRQYIILLICSSCDISYNSVHKVIKLFKSQ